MSGTERVVIWGKGSKGRNQGWKGLYIEQLYSCSAISVSHLPHLNIASAVSKHQTNILKKWKTTEIHLMKLLKNIEHLLESVERVAEVM